MTRLALLLPCLALALHGAPNFVVVFIDDMGWGDFSCFGNRDATTANVDRLAEEGLRFEQFYVNSPICSPSRVALSTGQYPQRWRIGSFLSGRDHNERRGIAQWLDPEAPMLARSLQQAGYATGHFGKWHMGGQRDVDDAPVITEYGFDASLTNFEGMGPKLLPLTLRPRDRYPGRTWEKAEILGRDFRWMLRSHITQGFVDEALAFIESARDRNKPFYINLWPDDVHGPLWPPVDRWSEDLRERYLAVLEAMDEQLGSLFDAIRDDPGLADNTLILVMSDNGPARGAGRAGPLRGYKTHLHEGGIRSPLVAWGPGLLARTNAVDRTSVFSAIDLVPTLLEIAQVAPPPDTVHDGESLVSTLLGRSRGSRKAPLFFRRPPDRDSFYGVADLPDLAVRQGRWKLLCEYDGSRPELYDLDADPSETRNRAADHPDTVRKLTDQLVAWHLSLPRDRGAELAGGR